MKNRSLQTMSQNKKAKYSTVEYFARTHAHRHTGQAVVKTRQRLKHREEGEQKKQAKVTRGLTELTWQQMDQEVEAQAFNLVNALEDQSS